MIYRIILFLAIIANIVTVNAMEYGLRFHSHKHPASQRTTLPLGDGAYDFKHEISVGFEMGFYDSNCFGVICTIYGNDGTTVSLVSSEVNGEYQPGIVINDKLHLIPEKINKNPKGQSHPVIVLKKDINQVLFIFDKGKYTFSADLSKISTVRFELGKTTLQASVAPVDIQEVRIFVDKKNTHNWELKKHYGDTVIDHLSGNVAVASSPHWIIDDHTKWTEIYSLQTDDPIQTAFDSENDVFYIASAETINVLDIKDGKITKTIPIHDDGRVMKYSNYLTFNGGKLISYSMESNSTSTFDFSTNEWSRKGLDENAEAKYANHGYATDGKYAYMFGGYGFHLYNNTLTRLNIETGEMENLVLKPQPTPRTSTAMYLSDNKLYLFGGMGNSVGKQEIPACHYYDLWEYDTKTLQGRKLWEMNPDTITNSFLPTSQMYYVPQDSSFYFGSTLKGGCMMRINLNHPGYETVSEPIHTKMDYRDCVFNLYQSKDSLNYYLLIDKRLDDKHHDYSIYRITYPFADNQLFYSFPPPEPAKASTGLWKLIIGMIIVLATLLLVYLYVSRKKARNVRTNASQSLPEAEEQAGIGNQGKQTSLETIPASTSDETELTDDLLATENFHNTKHFNRQSSAISLLGGFKVRDKNGEDITQKFTTRLRDLLLLVLLYSKKEDTGISNQKIDEIIWSDMDEKSAKNNRNVYMRKLRLLLEEIGDIDISYSQGYYHVNSTDICIDYFESINRLEATGTPSDNMDSELIELLLYGPLLPDIHVEWLDPFKGFYTELSLQYLNTLLVHEEKNNNDVLACRIAEIIFKHDSLNEEALAVRCRILYNRRMKGPAKNVYDSFCREYRKSFGEEYPIPFSKIIN